MNETIDIECPQCHKSICAPKDATEFECPHCYLKFREVITSNGTKTLECDWQGKSGSEWLSVDQAKENAAKDHGLRNGFWVFFIGGLACMGIATLILSDVGFTVFDAAVISAEGLRKMLWTRAAIEVVWIVVMFIMSCKAIANNGIRGFKNFFTGMILGAVLAGFVWTAGSAIFTEDKHSSSSSYYNY